MTCYDMAQRFAGIAEVDGPVSNPAVLTMLQLDKNSWVEDDAVPWCSAFANFIAWMLRMPRSKSLAARSWLTVGTPVSLDDAEPGNDVVIFKRGKNSPGANVLKAPGHVAFFAGVEGVGAKRVILALGGNQSDKVSIARYPVSSLLGIRRLR